ncbi:hypothetical protein GDO81_009430 [Engystomops pustulosus]|uniref:Uncharacterized protein n=1 Tax=Engystomops pustulosus TaxID=76066 RepID=A0AAV7BQU0_ENGPU|nr:hypothetical protein GDO81_009430 [Engystomops pustulosus]
MSTASGKTAMTCINRLDLYDTGKVFDQSALSTDAKEEMYKLYPNARRAHLKTGGNFPYLCRSAEVNLYVQIHLRQFHGTRYAAIDPAMVSAEELEVQKGNLQPSEEPKETEAVP